VPEFDATFAWAVLIVFGAAAIAGLAGFGFSIVSVSPLLIFYPPATVIAINKILTLGTTWVILLDTWRLVSWSHLRRLLPGAVIGMGVGVLVLKAVEPQAIELAVGIMVILFALLLLSGLVQHLPEQPWMAPVAGLASGVSSTSTGLSGPPLVLLFTVIGMPVQVFRGTSAAYFLLIDAVGFPALISQGLITRDDVVLSLLLAPVAIAGRWVGSLLVPYVTPASFRRVVLVLLLVTGTVAIANVVVTM
jgi:uncharacterized membrane protein YfcA